MVFPFSPLRDVVCRLQDIDEFVDTFVKAAKKQFPKAILHFEDFGLHNARRLLEKYRPEMACFNDDIQGTGVVTIAAITAAAWIMKMEVHDLRMVVFGAGTAGTGMLSGY
jgi:malate dehydrogenase (oxaloacetate-decarboxylating)